MDGIYGSHTITLPLPWLTAVATSDLRLAVYAMRGLYGVTRFSHLVAMASFVGMVVILDLRGLGLFPPAALDPARPRLVSVLKWSFWVTTVTGVLLFLRDPLGGGAAHDVPAQAAARDSRLRLFPRHQAAAGDAPDGGDATRRRCCVACSLAFGHRSLDLESRGAAGAGRRGHAVAQRRQIGSAQGCRTRPGLHF